MNDDYDGDTLMTDASQFKRSLGPRLQQSGCPRPRHGYSRSGISKVGNGAFRNILSTQFVRKTKDLKKIENRKIEKDEVFKSSLEDQMGNLAAVAEG